MNTQESRTQTLLANLQRENQHRNCTALIKSVSPHWGLYCDNPKCKQSGAWIKWISKDALKQNLKKNKSKR